MKKDKKDKFLDAMGDTGEINISEYQSAYVWCTVQGERLRITVDDRTSGLVRIPMLINASGNYHIEPIRLTTENANRYYSNEMIFDIA